MAKINNIETVRVNMNLPVQLVNQVKQYSVDMGLPFTQGYTILLQNALNNIDQLKTIQKFTEAVNKVDEWENKKDTRKLNELRRYVKDNPNDFGAILS